MTELALVAPSAAYAGQIASYRDAFLAAGEVLHGSSGLENYEDPLQWLQWVQAVRLGQTHWNPALQYLCVREPDGRAVGMVNIRLALDDYLSRFGGHIGYGIHPAERRNGYAKAQLRMALDVCRKEGIHSVLLTCRHGNTASARTILACGGVLENELFDERKGELTQRYWITL